MKKRATVLLASALLAGPGQRAGRDPELSRQVLRHDVWDRQHRRD